MQFPVALKNKWVWIVAGVLAAVYFFGDTLDTAVAAMTDDPSFTQWDSFFQQYGAQSAVPWRWLKAICMNESSLGQAKSVLVGLSDPSNVDGSKSSDGLSWGLMQVTLATANGLVGPVTPQYLNDPGNSVRLGAMLVAQLIKTFGIDDRQSVIRAYNGGPKFGAATIPYYTRFQANLAVVMSNQPGNELEFSP